MARIDPLLSAVIAKLPAAGGEFPRESRVNWLKTLAMALGMAYGEVGAIAIDPAAPVPVPAMLPAALPYDVAAGGGGAGGINWIKEPDKSPRYAFFVDKDGMARGMKGNRINANQLNGDVLYDLRGEAGDLAAITWADDTRGIPRGMQIDISAVA